MKRVPHLVYCLYRINLYISFYKIMAWELAINVTSTELNG